jgi:hypothetical protein
MGKLSQGLARVILRSQRNIHRSGGCGFVRPVVLACFFGMPGSMNDINVLQRSPLLHVFLDGSMPEIRYEVNGNSYTTPYWLVDGIYPNWPVFMKPIPDPQGVARKHYAMLQESCSEDVERAFGVLQKRFAFVRNPARSWKTERLNQIMKTCIILHNMIVEEQRSRADPYGDDDFDGPPVRPLRNRHRRQ